LESKHIGDLIRWVFEDIKKEESDTMEASGLKENEVRGAAAKVTKDWFFKNLS
jgi:hypothetical protein